jgi:hypothetical protein
MMRDEFATAGAGMNHLRAGLMSWVRTSDADPGSQWYKFIVTCRSLRNEG